MRDKEIKDYLIKGKHLAEKQINALNKILVENELFPTVPVSMEVTDSNISPFSDKLILFLTTSLNANGIKYLGQGLATAMRKDLGTHYSRFMVETAAYAEDGISIMIKRGYTAYRLSNSLITSSWTKIMKVPTFPPVLFLTSGNKKRVNWMKNIANRSGINIIVDQVDNRKDILESIIWNR